MSRSLAVSEDEPGQAYMPLDGLQSRLHSGGSRRVSVVSTETPFRIHSDKAIILPFEKISYYCNSAI